MTALPAHTRRQESINFFLFMAKLNKKKVKNAIEGSGGIISVVAQKCGVSRQAIYNYLEKHSDLKTALEQQKQMLVDKAESNLVEAVNAKQWGATKYVLSTLGKDRGYTTKVESEQSGELKIIVED